MKAPKLAAVVFSTSMLWAPLYTFAGPDPTQQELLGRLAEARQKLEQAETAKASELEVLLHEHMHMMQENMEMMETIKPKEGTSMQDYEEWIAWDRKLMKEIMEQMMLDQHILMQISQ